MPSVDDVVASLLRETEGKPLKEATAIVFGVLEKKDEQDVESYGKYLAAIVASMASQIHVARTRIEKLKKAAEAEAAPAEAAEAEAAPAEAAPAEAAPAEAADSEAAAAEAADSEAPHAEAPPAEAADPEAPHAEAPPADAAVAAAKAAAAAAKAAAEAERVATEAAQAQAALAGFQFQPYTQPPQPPQQPPLANPAEVAAKAAADAAAKAAKAAADAAAAAKAKAQAEAAEKARIEGLAKDHHLSVEQVKMAEAKEVSVADMVKYVRLAEEFGLTVDKVMHWEEEAIKHRLDLRVALVLVTATETHSVPRILPRLRTKRLTGRLTIKKVLKRLAVLDKANQAQRVAKLAAAEYVYFSFVLCC